MTIEKELTKFNYLLTGLFEDGLEDVAVSVLLWFPDDRKKELNEQYRLRSVNVDFTD